MSQRQSRLSADERPAVAKLGSEGKPPPASATAAPLVARPERHGQPVLDKDSERRPDKPAKRKAAPPEETDP
jgi:hypothetical protein